MTVMVDEIDTQGAVARSTADTPGIDGVLRIADGQSLKPGQLVRVRVTGADAHDLVARLSSA